MRPGRRLPAAALAAWLVFAAAAKADGADPGERPATACLERALVVVYLHQLQDHVMERWIVPEDSLADQTVVVRFRLAEDGSFLTYQLLSWTNRRIANSVELALANSGPFGWIPEDATCLVGRAVEMRFENPH
jgi:hypothetical protein